MDQQLLRHRRAARQHSHRPARPDRRDQIPPHAGLAHRPPSPRTHRRGDPVRAPARPDDPSDSPLGTYDSGFPDERAYEDWLYRLDRLADDHQQLVAGEQVSGPAADTYRHRIGAAHQQFAGRVLNNIRHARDVVANPLLQIYPGRAMTCVFDPAKALCQLHSTGSDVRRTPDQDDCRPNCQNIAYTDRDIADLNARLAELQDLTADHLSPQRRSTASCAGTAPTSKPYSRHTPR